MNRPDDFANLAAVTRLQKRKFLERYVTVNLLAKALGPRDQGITAYVGWLLGPKFALKLDAKLIMSAAESLPREGQLCLLELEALSCLPPPSFFMIASLLAKSICARKSPPPASQVQAFHKLLFMHLQRRPFARTTSAVKIKKLIKEVKARKVPRNIYGVCLKAVVEDDSEGDILAMIAWRKAPAKLGIMLDALNIDRKVRQQVLGKLRRLPHGPELISALNRMHREWAAASRRDG
jgi:hypothetical protein